MNGHSPPGQPGSGALQAEPNSTPQPPRRSLLRSLFHWGPIFAVAITGTITLTAVIFHMQWWPLRTPAAYLSLSLLLMSYALMLFNLMTSSFVGPGYVRLGWRPASQSARDQLQYCKACESYKAPRSHHCRVCNRCVLKMQHHCPWINNCVGFRNEFAFIQFMCFTVLVCIQSTWITASSIWYGVFKVYYYHHGTGREPIVDLTFPLLFAGVLAFGLGVGAIWGVGHLLLVQLHGLIRNRTSIEDYIILKGAQRRSKTDKPFVFPYDLGFKRNLTQVVTWSGDPIGDGYEYPVIEGCDQFTLTNEQLAQKEQKRHDAVLYQMIGEYSGTKLFAFISYGCCLWFMQPILETDRLVLRPGDRVIVTRATKLWLYGEKEMPGEDISLNEEMDSQTPEERKNRQRGWFPRYIGRRAEQITSEETPKTEHQVNTSAQHEKAD